jgi:hypothetical protein
MAPIPVANKQTALEYLDALERASQIARFRFKRDFSEWWDQASRPDRLAMTDLLAGRNVRPLTTNIEARARARIALKKLHERSAAMRDAYIRRRYELPDDRG